MNIFILFLLLIIVKSDDSGSCGSHCSYTFINSTGTMIFDGYYYTTSYADYNEIPWFSHRSLIRHLKIKEE